MRWPKPMIRLPESSVSRTHFSGSPIAATSSSIGFTYAGAPPCSGPERAPTAGESGRLVGLWVGHLRVEVVVDEQAPHSFVGVVPHELLDIDAAIAERAALAVGLGNLRFDRDDALEARFELVHRSGH